MKSIKRCLDCQAIVTWNKRSSICENCYEKRLKIKIIAEDRKVESPHASWF
ncbi:hypothetical protein [Pseudogracilibacillus auburnensis]|uniref:hypothetical protein n=1 Tax=Pseudogracilibacillus auburnensis TaxID=1494959 RepID=UPI001A966F14|nr:hypothetical protein [Pseudogracilibacillus auburnensis]MBO1005633.1 hypothetical protein [Pseudogracilibacillus auburnensis]